MWDNQQVNHLFNSKLPGDWHASGVSHDTRVLNKGEIYVALKGPNFDGHNFVQSAYEAGASAALVEHHVDNVDPSFPQIIVENVLSALEDLGRLARQLSAAKIVALTGSVGKTSSKEALNHVLKEQASTYVTPRSFNNHWGVPLSLAKLPQDARYAILELGMNNLGEISSYTKLIQPNVAYVTNVEGIHIGKLGSLEQIAKAKAEVFQGLQADGIAIVNRFSNYSDLLEAEAKRCGAKEIWSIGSKDSEDIFITNIEQTIDGQIIEANMFGEKIRFEIDLKGFHWPMNFIGVLAVVKAVGCDVQQAAKSLKTFHAIAGRGEQHRIELGDGKWIQIIDESYNAGPISMKAALNVLGQMQPSVAGRRIAVLGDMLELGEVAEEEHKNLKTLIEENQVDLVYTSGENMQHLATVLYSELHVAHDNDPEKLTKMILSDVQPGDVYMVKGSRGRYHMNGRMYPVVEALLSLDHKGVKKINAI